MTLTNVAEYVSSLGFHLELCKVLLSEGESAAVQRGLTLAEVDTLNKDEVEMVMLKAGVDNKYLLGQALGSSDPLATYLLRRLVSVHPSPTCDEVSVLGQLFAWVVSGTHEEKLGKGASASVYKVKWLGTPVAKKTFLGRVNPFFLKEVQILSQLWHPNITSMFCCTTNRRSCSIIMELMDEDLFSLIQRRCAEHSDSDSPPFSTSEAVDLMLQIARGVNYLHSKGIIHRDLKSMNILVKMVRASLLETGYVQAKVADFGLSKTKERSATYSHMTYNEGTPRWMAPELVNPSADDPECLARSEGVLHYKFKCDVYSFAMVCYEILTGDVPFKDEPMPKKIKQLVLEHVRPELPASCPTMLRALIEKCWAGTPEERPTFPIICSSLRHFKYLLMRGPPQVPPLPSPSPVMSPSPSGSATPRGASPPPFASSPPPFNPPPSSPSIGRVQGPGHEPQAPTNMKGVRRCPPDLVGPVSRFPLRWRRPFRIFISYAGGPNGSGKEFPVHLYEAIKLRYAGFRSMFLVKPFNGIEDCPLGSSFQETILEELERFDVGFVVVTPNFFQSRWPMIELVKFVDKFQAQFGDWRRVLVLPLFYKMSCAEVKAGLEERIWDKYWVEFSEGDHPLQVEDCRRAVSGLCQIRGITYMYFPPSEHRIIEEILAWLDGVLRLRTREALQQLLRLCLCSK